MDTFYFASTPTVNNTDLNLENNKDISCKSPETAGGRVFSGIYVAQNQDKKTKSKIPNIITSSDCSGISLSKALDQYPVGTTLNTVCDCELMNVDDGKVECPADKFIKSYLPSLNKVTCCSPCNDSGNIKTQFKTEDCSETFAKIDMTNPNSITSIKCPTNNYMKGFTITNNTASAKCCYPILGGDVAVNQGIQYHKCQDLGITDNCNKDNVKNYESYCKKYGILSCNKDNVVKFQNDCEINDMNYTTIDGETRNPGSNKMCHQDTINSQMNESVMAKIKKLFVNAVYNKYVWIGLFLTLLIIMIIFFAVRIMKNKK